MKKLLSTLTGTLLLVASHSALANCQDDPRLYTIKTVVSDIDSGKTITPLKLTPATYLSLTPATRQALGDNISVLDANCVPVEVINGEPARKLPVAYETLATELQHAAIRQDKDGFLRLLRLFKAQSKPSSSIISLIGPLSWPEPATAWAREIGVFTRSPQVAATSYVGKAKEAKCNTRAAHLTHIEMFALLGGTVSDRATVLAHKITDSSDGMVFADTNGGYLKTFNFIEASEHNSVWCRTLNYPAITGALSAINMHHVTNGNSAVSWGQHSSMNGWLKTQYPDRVANAGN